MRTGLFLLLLASTAWGAPPDASVVVVAPRSVVEVWRAATPEERELLFHLVAAGEALRPVVFFQTHRHALRIRRFLQRAFRPEHLARTRRLLDAAELDELTRYAAVFLLHKGPYDDLTSEKTTLARVRPERLARLWRATIGRDDPEIVRFMTDPAVEANEYPAAPEGLPASGGNLYEHGLTAAQVGDLVTTPNCRVVLHAGRAACQRLAAEEKTLDPEVRATLRLAATHLEQAAPFAGSEAQGRQLRALAGYFRRGDPADAETAKRAFLDDPLETHFRFYAEFLFVQYDYRGVLGKLEVTLQETDRELTRVTRELARSAGYFEAKFPYGEWRAQFPADYAPGILMVRPLYRGGMGSEDPGLHLDGDGRALNIVPAPLAERAADPRIRGDLERRLRAYAVDQDAELALAHHDAAVTRIVLLHELIGHGSGRVDPAKYGAEDPYSAMGPDGGSLEELRANLASIAMALDPKLVAIGLARTPAELEALLRAWVTQYVSMTCGFVAGGQPVVWPHIRASVVLIGYWLEQGALERSGGRFAIRDLRLLVRASTELLERVQRVRATRDERGLHELYDRYVPAPWAASLPGVAAGPLAVIHQPIRVTRRGIELAGDPARLETIIPFL